MDTLNELNNIIREKKCWICKNVLSVGPITMKPGDEQTIRCGRCKDIECERYKNCSFYEDILKCLSFPCIYQNCVKVVPWKDVEEHEKNCRYRTITCPIYYQQCGAIIRLDTLKRHFHQSHLSNVQHNQFCHILDKNISNQPASLVVIDNDMFLIYIFSDFQRYGNSQTSISVFSLSSSNKFTKFNVTFSDSANDSFSVMYNNQQITSYDDRKHCFKCFSQKCDVKHHPYSNIYGRANGTMKHTLSVNIIQYFTQFANLKVVINFIPNKLDNQANIGRDSASKAAISDVKNPSGAGYLANTVLRTIIECPICNQFMSAPIYFCKVGHVLCATCRSSLSQCPYCKQEMTTGRCYVLERMVENIQLSCLNEDKGCPFVGKLEEIKQHETDCPLECK